MPRRTSEQRENTAHPKNGSAARLAGPGWGSRAANLRADVRNTRNRTCEAEAPNVSQAPRTDSEMIAGLSYRQRNYGGSPASRQASVKACASAGSMPMAAQIALALKDGCNTRTCRATALASWVCPSFASAADRTQCATLKLGLA